jgi:hypothetical protein
MSWSDIHKTNRRRSARKARRERAERKAMTDRLGGPVAVDELRGAAVELRQCQTGYGPHDIEVWTFRGREWRIVIGPDPDFPLATIHRPWRFDPDMKEWLPLTPGARKWVLAKWAQPEGV